MSTKYPIIKEKIEECIYKHTQPTKVNYYYHSSKVSRDGQRMDRAFDTLEEARAFKKELERIEIQKDLSRYKLSFTDLKEFPINVIEILQLDLTSCLDKFEERLNWLFKNTCFTEREEFIFYRRFQHFETLEEVSALVGVTRERIRQIEAKMLRKMKRFARYLELGEYANKVTLAEKEYQTYIAELKEKWTYESAKEFVQQYELKMATPKVISKIIEDISDLDLSVRSYNCLRRAGVQTVQQLLQINEEDLGKIRNMGKKSVREIKQRLAEFNLELPEESICNIKRSYWNSRYFDIEFKGD